MTGRIKFWNAAKFFGFIETESENYFFHGTSWIGDADATPPMVGDAVTFELGTSTRGAVAINVEVVTGAAVA